MSQAISHLAVVVPAHNEEELLGYCLTAIDATVSDLGSCRPDISTDVVIVLDSCTDESVSVASRTKGVRVVQITASRVGVARAAGVRRALEESRNHQEMWIANTDADSVVPVHWLRRQVELAENGADVVTGTVVPAAPVGSASARAWWSLHRLGEDHPYLHGANLGVRASAYLAAGGFPDLACHEDVALVTALRATGWTCRATDTTRVTTSARLRGRVPGGFAGFLAALALPGA